MSADAATNPREGHGPPYFLEGFFELALGDEVEEILSVDPCWTGNPARGEASSFSRFCFRD